MGPVLSAPVSRVLCYSPYNWWDLHGLWEMTILHALKLRGADIRYVLCDGLYSDCDIFWRATAPRPPSACEQCQPKVANLVNNMGLPFEWLGRYLTPKELTKARQWADNLATTEFLTATYDNWLVGEWVEASVHSHLRLNEMDFTQSVVVDSYRSYLYSGLVACFGLDRLLAEYRPEVLLLFNGRMASPRVALELARQKGIHVICHERGLLYESLSLFDNVSCTSLEPYRRTWSNWGHIPLSQFELDTISRYMFQRQYGEGFNWDTFSPSYQELDQLCQSLKLSQQRPIWVLFTSSEDEVITEKHFLGPFAQQLDWIQRTIAFANCHPELDLVIRVHPNTGGKRSTGKNLTQLNQMNEIRHNLPANVRMVMPDDPISSYSLMDLATVGLVYATTVGLELTCKGKTTIVASNGATVGHLPFVTTVTDIAAYEDLLAEKLNLPPKTTFIETQQLAYRFAYGIFFRLNIPFPLVRMPDPHNGQLAYNSLDALKPGCEPNLDRICRIILHGVPVYPEPINQEPQHSETAELEWLETMQTAKFSNWGSVQGKPLVSVVIPCYNYGRYLNESVQSVLKQTFQDFEIIIINDGSTDNSQQVAEQLVATHPAHRIRLINQPNSGQPAISRNVGIAEARGKYILPLDADDLIAPTMLEECVRVLNTHPTIAIAYTDSVFFNDSRSWQNLSPEYNVQVLINQNILCYCSLFRREVWEVVGGYKTNVKGYEDWDFWIGCAEHHYLARRIPQLLFHYQVKPDGLYADTAARDQQLRAQIVLNHPSLYNPTVVAKAEKTLQNIAAQSQGNSITATNLTFDTDVAALMQQADAAFAAGNLEEARDKLKTALDFVPDEPQLIIALGNILLHLGELDAARREFFKATVLYPNFGPAHTNLAAVLLHLEQVVEAETSVRRALNLDPTDTNALKILAQLYLVMGHYEEGIKTYADVLQDNPTDADALLALGTCYVEVEDFASALKIYQRISALLPPGELLETVRETILELQNIIETNSSIEVNSGNRGLSGETEAMVEPVQSVEERSTPSSEAILPQLQGFSFCIITAGTRPDLLNLVIKSIRVQNIPNYEIIVVGQYDPEPGIIYVPAEEAAASGGLSQLRNLGVAKAQYDHIVILDDDIILTTNWYQAFLNFGDKFDILTSRILLPDGTRYWDHATIDGPRGHRLLRSDERDEQYVYMSGGTAWIMKGYVAQSVRWNETLKFNEKEDVDFARKCQAKNFKILHNPNNVAYHYAAKYTRVGRINVARLPEHTNLWLLSRTEIKSPDALLRLIQEETANQEVAELADCLRAGIQVFPDDVRFRNLWKELEQMYGGDVLGDRWYLHGDPKFAELINDLDQVEIPIVTAVPSIFWAASLFDFSGYAWLSRQVLPTLAQRNVSLQAQSFTFDEKLLTQLKSQPTVLTTWEHLLNQQVNQGVFVIFHPPVSWGGKDFFAYYRQHNPGFDAYVGITMFETDRLPAGWAHACNQMDEVWVPATFNRDTFITAGVNPAKLQVIPFGLDTNIYDPAKVTPLDIPGKRGFAFLSVFQWSKRKGWDVLLKAYLSAFSADDDVSLVIRAYPGNIKEPTLRQRLDAYITDLGYDPPHTPSIILVEQFIAESEMPALYASADAFVLPTRGEGWGIPFMEAMAMGLPVIATRWSAHLDFMSDANSYLIDIEGLVPVDPEQTQENPFYTSDQQWAEPSVTHTAALMRHVFEQQTEARAKGAQARRDIQEHWTLDRTANWIIGRGNHLGKADLSNHPTSNNKQTQLVSNSHSPSVLWHAPIYDPSGYADEARNFILQLRSHQLNISASAIGRDSVTFRSQLAPEIQAELDLALTHQPDRNYISLIHFPAYAFRRMPQADYNVGRVMFETDGLPSDWVAKCNQMDEIWVPTEFNLQTFRNAGITAKLVKIPGGIDTDRFRPGLEPLPIPSARSQVFLSIFEWGYRKGWDVLLRAWAKAFRPNDDVCLVLRTYPINQADGFDAQTEIEQRINHFLKHELRLSRQMIAPIIVLGEQVSEQDLPRLHTAATAYVSCSRGEGWGRPQMQAMACGLPVIATRWGGNLEFMTEANSLLLDVEALVKIDERAEIPFYRGQSWAEPSLEHLVTLLRHIHDNPGHAATIGQQARHDMVEKWQWSTVAAIAAERLQTIQMGLKAKSVNPHLTTQPVTLRWEGSQFVVHSLALINREICLRLAQDKQFDLAVIPYETHQFGPEVDPRFKHIEKNLNRSLSRPADVHVRHQWPPNLNSPAEGHWVMIQPWEFGSLPKEWIAVMREKVDEVWAYSNYVRNCYIQSGMPEDRIFVVSPGVDTTVFRPDTPPLPLKTKKQFKFLFVGGTITRKGIDILLDAYTHAFTVTDDVCLVIKDMGGQSFYQGQTAQKMITKIQHTPGAPEIEYIDRTLNEVELAGLYTACDCLVHPYRGEGFGLPIAEAMAAGLPVIVTGYGAAMDFCHTDNAYLIPARTVQLPEKCIGEQETVDFPWWAEPDVVELKLLLHHVFTKPQEAKAKGQNGMVFIRANYTWNHAANVVKERLKTLCDKPIRRLTSQVTTEPQPQNSTFTTKTKAEISGDSMANNNILNNMIEAMQQAGQWHQAIQLLQEAVKYVQSGPEAAALWNSLGVSYFQTKQVPEAETAFLRGLNADPKNLGLLHNLAELYLQQELYDQATEYLNRALRVNPDDVSTLLSMGQCAIVLGAFDVALMAYRRVKVLAPETAGIEQIIKEIELADQPIESSANGYHSTHADVIAVQETANQVLAAGQIALEKGDLGQAAKEFAWVAAQYPDFAAAHMALGTTLLAMGRNKAAVTSFYRVTELLPQLAAGYNQLGIALYRLGQPAEAETAFQQANQLDAADLEPLLNLVDLYRGQQRYEAASAAIREALALNPNHTEVLVAFGLLCLALNDTEGANMTWQRLKNTPAGHAGVQALGQALGLIPVIYAS